MNPNSHIQRYIPCNECNGRGFIFLTDDKDCEPIICNKCNGTRLVYVDGPPEKEMEDKILC
jgi:DnaJ-class molecular chaperone